MNQIPNCLPSRCTSVDSQTVGLYISVRHFQILMKFYYYHLYPVKCDSLPCEIYPVRCVSLLREVSYLIERLSNWGVFQCGYLIGVICG